jgi:AAA15 family ATPase/GTPase
MLLRFRVSNYRSLRDEQELSMVASSLDDPQGAVVRLDDLGLGVLPVAAIYGANAAGKSSVLGALQFMRDAVMGSHRRWRPEGPVPLDPFLLDTEHREGISRFEVDFLVEGVRHRYGFELDREKVVREWLSAYPHQREQAWFTRDAGDAESFKFGKSFKGNNRVIEALTRANSLFLSAAAENNHQGVLPIYSWFSKNLRVIQSRDRDRLKAETVRILRDDERRASALDLLRSADLGITGIQVKENRLDDKTVQLIQSAAKIFERDIDIGEVETSFPLLEFQHRDKAEGTFLPFEHESKGTQVWLTLVGELLRTLGAGSLLCVDELDASLHPHLALEVIRAFQDPARNPKHAQLIFNTHDTTLLGNLLDGPHLRRDQVWFVEKDGEGATHLYPLTDFKPRKDENLERGYLQGRYGAIPFIEPVPLVKGE